MVPILKKQVKNLQNEEASQNRIILPKARNAIQGIAIGNPVKIKFNQKLRNPSSDSDKSTNENPKILAQTNNLPMLQPKPFITHPQGRHDNSFTKLTRAGKMTNKLAALFSLKMAERSEAKSAKRSFPSKNLNSDFLREA